MFGFALKIIASSSITGLLTIIPGHVSSTGHVPRPWGVYVIAIRFEEDRLPLYSMCC